MAAALFMLPFAASCDMPYEIEQPLGVTTKTVKLQARAGETPVVVYAAGDWTADLTENVDWASIDRLKGHGLSEIKFAYSQNFGAARKVGIIFYSSKEIPDTVMMIQAAGNEKPIFQFTKEEVTAPKNQGKIVLGFKTDLIYDMEDILSEVEYDQEDSKDWISNVEITAENVTLDIAENSTGMDRTATLKLTHTDAADKEIQTYMKIRQVTTEPFLDIDRQTISNGLDCVAQHIELPVETNLSAYLNVLETQVEYEGTQKDWISNIEITEKTFTFDVTDNKERTERIAKIVLIHKDVQGGELRFEVPVMQTEYIKLYTFEELKALIPGTEGEIIFDESNYGNLNAVVIGDKDNENMDLNPNIAPRKIDWEGNPTTNYIQNAEGTSGLRIKCASKADNVFKRYSEITLNLEGMKLVKEAAPARYTLMNVSEKNVLNNVEGYSSNVPYKERTIGQLTEDDLYTFTTLKEMEMTFKYGSYTNCHDGYQIYLDPANVKGTTSPFYDCVPASMRDAEGNSMYMVTNGKTPWRRTGKGVPQGKANISGIIVNCKLLRFAKDGDLGDYSIRVLEEEDIVPAGSRFSKTLAEWHWGGQTTDLTKATTGEGNITCSLPGVTVGTNNNDFNNVINNNGGKGNVTNGACVFSADYWWDDKNNMAPYFLIEFSTREISGSNLTFNWTVGQGNGGGNAITAPAYWHIEYSTDGEHFTKLEKDYAVRPLVWWNNNLNLCAIPGLHEYTTALPTSLFGKEQVIIKIAASSKAAATSTETDSGTITAKSGNNIRFGEMAIEYN